MTDEEETAHKTVCPKTYSVSRCVGECCKISIYASLFSIVVISTIFYWSTIMFLKLVHVNVYFVKILLVLNFVLFNLLLAFFCVHLCQA